MKRLALLLVCSVVLTVSLKAQAPVVASDGVRNAASFTLPALPNSGIAQGSIFVVFGSNMGPATIANTTFPLLTTLSGTSIKVTVGGTTVSAYMIYTLAGQLAAVLPSNTPTGTGTLTVTFNGQSSNAVPITVVANTLGIFAINQAGSGPGVITNPQTQPASQTNAANPGDVDIIWSTGLGPVSGNEAAGPLPGNMPNLPVHVFVGGVEATVQYQGRSGCCAGLDQIQFVVPSGVTGCYVPVYVQVGNTVSNFVTMSIAASGRNCSDPIIGFTSADMQTLTSTGVLRLGSISLSRLSISTSVPGFGNVTINTDNGTAQFLKFDATTFFANSLLNMPSVYGSCMVFTFRGSSYQNPVNPTLLDAGSVINISGPNGAKTLTKQSDGTYSAKLGGGGIPGVPGSQPDYLSAGTYTANNGSGGANVGAFSTTMTNPQPLVWSNQSSVTTVVRASGQLITWTGGDPSSFVFIFGNSTLQSPQAGGQFTCIAPVSAGQFTIPAAVLLSLPAVSSSQGFLAVGTSTSPVVFTASGLDKGAFSSTVLIGASVAYQ